MSRTTNLAMLVVVVAATVAAVPTGVAATSPQAAFSPPGDSTHSADEYTASPLTDGRPDAATVPNEGAEARSTDVTVECHIEYDADDGLVIYCTITFDGEQLAGGPDDDNSEDRETAEVRLDADDVGSIDGAVEHRVHDTETITRSIATGEGARAAATDLTVTCEFGYDEERGWYLDCEVAVGTASPSGGNGDDVGNGGDAGGDRGERSRADVGSVESDPHHAGSATGTSSPNGSASAQEPGVRIECEWVHSEEHGWYLDCEVTVYTSDGDIVILGMNGDDGQVPAEEVLISVDADGSDAGDASSAADPAEGDARATETVGPTVSPGEDASAAATDLTLTCEFGYDEERGWYLDCELTVGTASPSGGNGDDAGNGGDAREVTPSSGENTTVTLAWATHEGDARNYTANASVSDDANDGDAGGERRERSRADVGSAGSDANGGGEVGGPSSPGDGAGAGAADVVDCEWKHNEEYGWYLHCEIGYTEFVIVIGDLGADGGNDTDGAGDGSAVGSRTTDGPDEVTVTLRDAKSGTISQTIVGGLHGQGGGNERTPNGSSPAGDGPAGDGSR